MRKIIKYGVEFQLAEDSISETEFQKVLDSLEFNAVFEKIDAEIKKHKENALYYTSEAAKAAKYDSWNNKSSREYLDCAAQQINEIPLLLKWVVKQRWIDYDKHGNSYSQVRKGGFIIVNYLLEVNYIFQ